ncbi:MAG: hypothetical protein P4L57_10025 [Rhizomicrobium sp.]|nr:hypothetical protein [Rhizomicrobium sp.]
MIAKIVIIDDDVRDLLLTDYHMPGMIDVELIEHLHAKGDDTPALGISGRLSSVVSTRAERIGVKVLEKPVTEKRDQVHLASAGERLRCGGDFGEMAIATSSHYVGLWLARR